MFRLNLLILYRNFKRSRSSFFINLISLSTGLGCALMIHIWVRDELNIDKFHINDRRLFQVMQNMPFTGGIHTTDATPGILADALIGEMPEVEDFAVESPGRGSKGIVSFKNTRINATEMYVSKNYFNVFSYKLLQGDKDQVLLDKYAVLLSEELALKLFRTTENVVGKTVEWDQGNLTNLKGQYVVSGIFEKPGKSSSVDFDLLFTYELLFETNGSRLGLNRWGNSDPSTFVLLKEGTDVDQFNAKIRNFIRTRFRQTYGDKNLEHIGTLFLQRYSEKYLYNRYENGYPIGGRIEYVRVFSVIAIFILGIGCINFMNLSTAKAFRRMKEIGIKKAFGARRKVIIYQVLKESVSMAFLTLPIAVAIVQILLPRFNAITGKQLSLSLHADAIISILVITLVTGLISGSYPALYLSHFRPSVVLRGKVNGLGIGGASWLRSGLVIFQFSISIILIVCVLVLYNQVAFINSKSLGYDKQNVIHFVTKGNILESGVESFLVEMKRLPGIVNAASYQSAIVSKENKSVVTNIDWDGKSANDMTVFNDLRVGYDFIETLGLELMGRSFSKEFAGQENKVIFNEAAIEAMQLEDPIGKQVVIEGEKKTIAGVVKNFHFESFYEPINPCYFVLRTRVDNIVVKIQSGRVKETLERLSKFYQEYNQGLPFEYDVLDEEYREMYSSEERVAVLCRYFVGIAILLSCLGLFGLSTFTAETRRKEIGIRKVLGSSVFGIVRLLSFEFTSKILVALFIALPLSYYIVKSWLNGFAFRIALDFWYFAGTAIITLIIAWLTIGVHIIKSANVNPVDNLRTE